jgi:uncharacterized membrane protein (UPF0136 family)
MENAARVVMLVYGLLMFGGGLGGYAVAHSKLSLAAGIISALLLGLAYYVSLQQPRVGFGIGAVVAGGLVIVFVRRIQELLAKTPPGSPGMNIGLCTLSALVALYLLFALSRARA